MFKNVCAAMEKLSDMTATLATMLLGCIMLAMVAFTGVQVGCRYLVGTALSWPEEVNVFFMVWITFIGSSLALKRAEHIGIDLFVEKLPPNISLLVRCFGHLIMTTFITLLIYYGHLVALLNITVVSDALEISMAIPRLGLVAGGLMMLIQMAWLLCHDVQKWRDLHSPIDDPGR